MKCIAIQVHGKVQGVFYRASAKKIAEQLGVKGFVRNESDGDVYIEAEAEEDILNRFTEWCRKGPPRASVESLGIKEIPVKHFLKFEVRR